jgi:hypothetical protein
VNPVEVSEWSSLHALWEYAADMIPGTFDVDCPDCTVTATGLPDGGVVAEPCDYHSDSCRFCGDRFEAGEQRHQMRDGRDAHGTCIVDDAFNAFDRAAAADLEEAS